MTSQIPNTQTYDTNAKSPNSFDNALNSDTWQRVLLARNPKRPLFMDYANQLFSEFDILHGDRVYGDDKAVIGGLARLAGKPVMLIGQHRGRSTRERIAHNFGMANPEGYRKAVRLAKMAERFGLPVLTFIDTQGAYPGVEAEERGQAIAIAESIAVFSSLKTPIIVTIIGEGGSGGALAIGMGDKINMLQNSIYSVISPEGCASILWKTAERAPDASYALKLDAKSLHKLGLIDVVVDEGQGAQIDDKIVMVGLKALLLEQLAELESMDTDERCQLRYEKFYAFNSQLGC
mgnify:FL=1